MPVIPSMYNKNNKELPERVENDFYPTPSEFCDAAVRWLLNWMDDAWIDNLIVYDPGCGNGVWGNSIKKYFGAGSTNLIGFDIVHREGLDLYNAVVINDYLYFDHCGLSVPNLIIGNPPYSLKHEFVDHSLKLLAPGGLLFFLLKSYFPYSKERYNRYFNQGNFYKPIVQLNIVDRIPFTADRPTEYSVMYLWHKDHSARDVQTVVDWLEWK